MKNLILLLIISTISNAVFAETGTIRINGNSSANICNNGGIVIVNGTVVSGNTPLIIAKGPNKSEQRNMGRYSSVRIDGCIDFLYTVSDKPSVTVNAAENILPLITTTIDQGQLIVTTNGAFSADSRLQITAFGPTLESFKVVGSGGIRANGLTGKSTRIKISGSGKFAGAGSVDRVDIQLSGSGNVDAAKLRANDLRVEVSGSGDVEAFSKRSANIELTGSGHVNIAGNPVQRNVERAGSGSISFK